MPACLPASLLARSLSFFLACLLALFGCDSQRPSHQHALLRVYLGVSGCINLNHRYWVYLGVSGCINLNHRYWVYLGVSGCINLNHRYWVYLGVSGCINLNHRYWVYLGVSA